MNPSRTMDTPWTDSQTPRSDHRRNHGRTIDTQHHGHDEGGLIPPVVLVPGSSMGDPADIIEALDLDSLRVHVRAELLQRIVGSLPSWHRDAACRGEPSSTFFIERGGSLDRARDLCAGCPVRESCLAEALDDETLDHGYRGGASVRERKRMRKERTT